MLASTRPGAWASGGTPPPSAAVWPRSISCADTAAFVEETSKKIRSFLYELAEGTSNYRSLHSLTEQVEHQYHGRFLVELIQNAHDALFTREDRQGHTGRIEIVFHPKEGTHGSLYVANDGHCFSSSNFRSLSQFGQSDKDPQESIGNKGIGFRSILEIADSPEVYSRSQEGSPTFDGFCFSFSPVIISRITPAEASGAPHLAPSRSAAADQALVADESAAPAREDRWTVREACALLLVTLGRGASPPAAVQRHVAQALGAAPAGRIEGNRLTDIWRRDGDERGSVGKMFPENGSGVDAAGDCGAWELDERATKQSGHAERGWMYKGPDAGGQNGNSG